MFTDLSVSIRVDRWRIQRHFKERAIITRASTEAVFFLCVPRGSGLHEFCRGVIEAAVAALALLIFGNTLEKMKAALSEAGVDHTIDFLDYAVHGFAPAGERYNRERMATVDR